VRIKKISERTSATEMTYIVSCGALNSAHSLTRNFITSCTRNISSYRVRYSARSSWYFYFHASTKFY